MPIIFEHWTSPEGCALFCSKSACIDFFREMKINEGGKQDATFVAPSWEEARQIHYEMHGMEAPTLH